MSERDVDNGIGTQAGQVVTFTWAAPRSFVPELRADLTSTGAELEKDDRTFTPPPEEQADYTTAAFEPLLLIAGAVAIGYLVDKIAVAVRNARHGGAVVDVRNGAVDIHVNPSVPGGTLVVVTDAGVQTIQEPAHESLASILATGAFGP